jgi:hypothetical protein
MKYEHILWNNEEGHDKIWGIIQLSEAESTNPKDRWGWSAESKYVTFWGRRGKSLQTKVWTGNEWEANAQRDKKLKKGYKNVNPLELETVYPEFEEDLEKTAVWGLLVGE